MILKSYNFSFQLKSPKHLEMSWVYFFSPRLSMWKLFFSQMEGFKNIQGKKVTIKQRCGRRINERPLIRYLCQTEELTLMASFTNDDYLFKAILTNVSQRRENIGLQKLHVEETILDQSNWIKENIIGKAFCKLKEVILTSRCELIPNQENEIYESIINTQEIALETLDLRRSSTSINEVNADKQAKAVSKLVTYKNTVNHEQARAILDHIYETNNIQLKYLLLIVRENDTYAGSFPYNGEKLNVIKQKLSKIKIVNDL